MIKSIQNERAKAIYDSNFNAITVYKTDAFDDNNSGVKDMLLTLLHMIIEKETYGKY